MVSNAWFELELNPVYPRSQPNPNPEMGGHADTPPAMASASYTHLYLASYPDHYLPIGGGHEIESTMSLTADYVSNK
jgi:hypothetical protein